MEILVAFGIMSIALGALMSVFNQGLSASQMSQFYAEASVIAQSKLAEVGRSITLEESEDDGNIGRYHWQVVISPYEWPDEDESTANLAGNNLKPLHILVRVDWKLGIRQKLLVVESVQIKDS